MMFALYVRPALMFLLLCTALFGVVYPVLTMAIAQSLFPEKANGSLMTIDKKVRGSALIGQSFSDPNYFWGRPSATAPVPYNATASTGSNLGAVNLALLDSVKQRKEALKKADPSNSLPIPVDLVTASASGLDPHISPAAAHYQMARIARLRKMPMSAVEALVEKHTEGRQFGILGEPRVNVLRLNLEMDSK